MTGKKCTTVTGFRVILIASRWREGGNKVVLQDDTTTKPSQRVTFAYIYSIKRRAQNERASALENSLALYEHVCRWWMECAFVCLFGHVYFALTTYKRGNPFSWIIWARRPTGLLQFVYTSAFFFLFAF